MKAYLSILRKHSNSVYVWAFVLINILITLLITPSITYSQSSSATTGPYTYDMLQEDIDKFTSENPGESQTEVIMNFNLPTFESQSDKHIHDTNYKEGSSRVCEFRSVNYDGVDIDCVAFRQNVTTPGTELELAKQYLCQAECNYDSTEGVWKSSFKIGANALKKLDATKSNLQTLFDNPNNTIAASFTVMITTDYIVSQKNALYSEILNKQGESLNISTHDENYCNYIFNIGPRKIEITEVFCRKFIDNTWQNNIENIDTLRVALNSVKPKGSPATDLAAVQYQALTDDCLTTHLPDGRDKIDRQALGLTVEQHFNECRTRCNGYEDCAGFAFNPRVEGATDNDKSCYLKSAACGVSEDTAVDVNTYNASVTTFRFFKKL